MADNKNYGGQPRGLSTQAHTSTHKAHTSTHNHTNVTHNHSLYTHIGGTFSSDWVVGKNRKALKGLSYN